MEFKLKTLSRTTSAIVLCWAAGCATVPDGGEQITIAQQLAGSGQYEEAIAYVNQALALAPENPEYTALLASYEQRMAEQINADVAATLGGAISSTVINTAESRINEGMTLGVDSELLASSSQLLATKRDEFYQGLASLYQKATVELDESQWEAAFLTLSEIAAVFPTYENVNTLIQTARDNAVTAYAVAIRGGLDADELAQVREIVANLTRIDPSNPLIQSTLQMIDSRDNKQYFIDKARYESERRDWVAARASCSRVFSYDAFDSYCSELMPRVLDSLAADTLSDARSYLERGLLFDASEKYLELLDSGSSGDDIEALRNGLIAQLGDAVAEMHAQNNFGLALRLIERQYQISASSVDSRLQRELQDRIDDRVTISIAVRDFNSPVEAPDAGAVIANNLTSILFEKKSSDIAIFERAQLDRILAETGLGRDDTEEQRMAINGIDIAIIGRINQYNVEPFEEAGKEIATYESGQEDVQNIEYLNWSARNPTPSRRQLEEAPPAYITRPITREIEVAVRRVSKKSYVQIGFNIVEVSTARTTISKTVEGNAIDEDVSRDGIAEAGIQADPLEIKTNTELLQEATEQALTLLQEEVLRPLSNKEQEYFDAAQNHEAREEFAEAVEKYMDVIAVEKLKSSVSDLSAESEAQINRLLHVIAFDA